MTSTPVAAAQKACLVCGAKPAGNWMLVWWPKAGLLHVPVCAHCLKQPESLWAVLDALREEAARLC